MPPFPFPSLKKVVVIMASTTRHRKSSVDRKWLDSVLNSPTPPRKKIPRKQTLTIQFRAWHTNGNVLDEKYIETQKDCTKLREMRDLILEHCPLNLCCALGQFSRTRLLPIHDSAPYTDFCVLYAPVESDEGQNNVVVGSARNAKYSGKNSHAQSPPAAGVPETAVKLASLPSEVIETFLFPLLCPKSIVRLAIADRHFLRVCYSGVSLGCQYDSIANILNSCMLARPVKYYESTAAWKEMHDARSILASLHHSLKTAFFRAVSVSSGLASKQVSTNLLRAVVGVQGMATLFQRNHRHDDEEETEMNHKKGCMLIERATRWDYSRLARYVLESPSDFSTAYSIEAINPLARFCEANHRLVQIFEHGGTIDQLLRIALTSKSLFICGGKNNANESLNTFSIRYFEFFQSMQRVREEAVDLLVNRTAVYRLKRTKRQILLLQEQSSLDSSKNAPSLTKNSAEKKGLVSRDKFSMHNRALQHGFKALQSVYTLLIARN